MSEESLVNRLRHRAAAEKVANSAQYTAKDFQLEVLSQLAEVQTLAESMEKNWLDELKSIRDQRLLKFDSRTLVALGAVILSVAAYVIQDARNSARQDAEIETTKTRITRLEQIAATNTEARIRTESQLQELREGQSEIKVLIQAHDSGSRKAHQDK
jgi:hypothetical protein